MHGLVQFRKHFFARSELHSRTFLTGFLFFHSLFYPRSFLFSFFFHWVPGETQFGADRLTPIDRFSFSLPLSLSLARCLRCSWLRIWQQRRRRRKWDWGNNSSSLFPRAPSGRGLFVPSALATIGSICSQSTLWQQFLFNWIARPTVSQFLTLNIGWSAVPNLTEFFFDRQILGL